MNKEKTEIKALQVRIPLPMYQELKKRTRESRRSLNAEVIFSLETMFAVQESFEKKKAGGK